MCEPQQQPNPVGPGTPSEAPIPPQPSFRENLVNGLRAQQANHQKAIDEIESALRLFEDQPQVVDGIEQLAKLGVMVGRSMCPF